MEEITRKDFLGATVNTLIGLWVAATALLSSYAGLRYLWPTEKTAGGPGGNEASFPLTELPEGEMKKVLIEGKPAGIIRINKELYALSLICTHLGCIVSWHPEEKRLICPCHGGVYDINGTVLGGPPPRPLPSYEVKLRGDTVVVG